MYFSVRHPPSLRCHIAMYIEMKTDLGLGWEYG